MCSIVWMMMFLGYSTLVSTQNPSPDYASQNKTIIILAGESNMAGRGGVVNNTWDGFVPRECQPNPQVFRLNAKLTWEEAREPLHKDIDVTNVCGIGPGMSFANSLLERTRWFGVIGLVPCAIGGTKLSQWSRGRALYNQMLNRARAAAKRDGDHIVAMLWYQGESDAYNSEDAESYQQRFDQFIADVKSDLQLPNLDVIQVASASGEGKYIDTVRKAQLEVNHTDARYKCVDSKGLEHLPDHLHLTTAAQIHLGQLLSYGYFMIFKVINGLSL